MHVQTLKYNFNLQAYAIGRNSQKKSNPLNPNGWFCGIHMALFTKVCSK